MEKCQVFGCNNNATHTWSGHPTCDDCGTPNRKKVIVKMDNLYVVFDSAGNYIAVVTADSAEDIEAYYRTTGIYYVSARLLKIGNIPVGFAEQLKEIEAKKAELQSQIRELDKQIEMLK